MRIGSNPEKVMATKLEYKKHRVIIPVYIPNVEEDYFLESLDIFKFSITSLLATIDLEITNISIINNNSCDSITEIIKQMLSDKKIDRHIHLRQNRGKVEPVLAEVLASSEAFITISDADIYFRKGWLERSLDIFAAFPNAGVVSPIPVPNLFSYENDCCIAENFVRNKLKFKSIIPQISLMNFEQSIDSPGLLKRFYKRQLVLESGEVTACLGAAHFVATYRRDIFLQNVKRKVPYVFINGLEREFIDRLANDVGLWRLSTVDSLVYHIGNRLLKSIEQHDMKYYVGSIIFPPLNSCSNNFFYNKILSKIARIAKVWIRKNI